MNREEVLQFKKKRFIKYGGFKKFGIVMGIITLFAMVGGLVLACVFPMTVDLNKTLVNIVAETFGSKEVFLNEIIYWGVYLAVVVGAAVYLLVNAIKMLSKRSNYSVNRFFGFPAWLAVMFVVFTTEQTSGFGANTTFKVFRYLFVGALVLVYVYSVVQLFFTGKLWKNNGKKLVFPLLLGFVASIAAVALCLTLVFVADVQISVSNIWHRFLGLINEKYMYGWIYEIPKIATVYDGFKIARNVLIVLFFAQLVSVASLLIVDFIKMFACKNYVRGSGYFGKSSVFCGAFRLALIPVLINVCTMILALGDGQEFVFSNFFPIGNVALFGGVLLLGIISSAVFSTDKSNSKYEPSELILAKTVSKINSLPEQTAIRKPEEEIIKVDAVDKGTVIERKEEIKEEPQPGIDKKEQEEEIKVEELPEEQEEIEEIEVEDEEDEETSEEETSQSVPPQQPFYGNVNVYPNALPNMPYGMPVQYYNPATGQIITYYVQQQVAQPVMQPQQFVPQGFIPCMPAGMQPMQGGIQQPQQMPVQGGVNPQQGKSQDVFSIPKKSLNEKLSELPQLLQSYYRQMVDYVFSKEDVKYSKSTFADSFYCGRDCIMKMQIKQNKIVCAFTLIDIKVREALKSDKYAKDQQTLVKIINRASLETAKDTFEMAYNLVLEAREARRQEQLKKRREARKNKQDNQ